VAQERVFKIPRSVIHAICPSPPADAKECQNAMNVINRNLHALANKGLLNAPLWPLVHAHWSQI